MYTNINVQELISWKNEQKQFTLLDVRENWEWEIGHIEGSLHIPLGELPSQLANLPDRVPMTDPVVTLCHHGKRSLQAAILLSTFGYHVHNLQGGIHAWSTQTHSSTIPTY